MILINNVFEIAKNLNLTLELEKKFGSKNDNHRLELRKNLIRNLNKSDITYQSDILNLKEIPFVPNAYISISHCKSLGGFTISDKPVGFDIEELSRISDSLIQRIMTESEKNLYHDLKFLWGAKEAVYKCLNHHCQKPIKTISEIHINNFNKITDSYFEWSALHPTILNSEQGKGYTYIDSNHIYTFFLFSR